MKRDGVYDGHMHSQTRFEPPPVLRILSDELPEASLDDREALRRVLTDRGLLRDLREQANHSSSVTEYPAAMGKSTGNGFAFFASSTLNPFSAEGKCRDSECRRVNARSIAALAALYTDFLAVPDEFAQMFRQSSGSPSQGDREDLATALKFYYELRPLLEAGVIRFTNPPGWTCPHCAAKAHPAITELVDLFWDFFLKEGAAEVHAGPGLPHIEFTTALNDGLVVAHEISRKEALKLRSSLGIQAGSDRVPRDRLAEMKEFVCGQFRFSVQRSLEHAAIAADRKLLGATTSTIDALALLAAQKNVVQPQDLDTWRRRRRLELPWVRDLRADQLLELRDNASRALPVFRESVAAKLGSGTSDSSDSDVQLEPIVAELRTQAEEVWAELDSIPLFRTRALSAITATSTIALTVAAVGTNNPVTGTFAMGLFALLAQLYQAGSSQAHEHDKLLAKPGYVLVAAREILGHGSGREDH